MEKPVCEKCGTPIAHLINMGYTEKSGFKKVCVSCNFPGYIEASWSDLVTFFKNDKDIKVYLYGQRNRKPYLYGPHGIHDTEKCELLNIKMNRSFPNGQDAMVVPFDLEIIKLDKEKKLAIEKISKFFGMPKDSSEDFIKKVLCKNTECGAWMEFNDFYCVSVGAIVEGVDFGTTPVGLVWPFSTEEFIQAVKETERQAKEIWEQTHGCESCGESCEYPGYNAIDPECSECQGKGTIL